MFKALRPDMTTLTINMNELMLPVKKKKTQLKTCFYFKKYTKTNMIQKSLKQR